MKIFLPLMALFLVGLGVLLPTIAGAVAPRTSNLPVPTPAACGVAPTTIPADPVARTGPISREVSYPRSVDSGDTMPILDDRLIIVADSGGD
jgi:hypothetical protein